MYKLPYPIVSYHTLPYLVISYSSTLPPGAFVRDYLLQHVVATEARDWDELHLLLDDIPTLLQIRLQFTHPQSLGKQRVFASLSPFSNPFSNSPLRAEITMMARSACAAPAIMLGT